MLYIQMFTIIVLHNLCDETIGGVRACGFGAHAQVPTTLMVAMMTVVAMVAMVTMVICMMVIVCGKPMLALLRWSTVDGVLGREGGVRGVGVEFVVLSKDFIIFPSATQHTPTCCT